MKYIKHIPGIISPGICQMTYLNWFRYKTLQRLIIDKAKQGVRMKIIVWQPRLPLRILPGADERGLDGRAGEVEVLSKLARKY